MVLWELVFMLVVLKIPLVYLCLVVWWAVRGEPREERPVAPVPVSDTPDPQTGWSPSPRARGPRPGRRGDRIRAGSRRATARAEGRR
jgi:hypothetical protein